MHLADLASILHSCHGQIQIQCENKYWAHNPLLLHWAICYLARGSFHDIHATVLFSKPSLHCSVWHMMHFINRCKALDQNFEELNCVWEGVWRASKDGVIEALDGWLMRISAPTFAECGKICACFSGHVYTYGVNVQAMCNSDCHFTFFCLSAPGKTNDSVAIQKTSFQLGFFHYNHNISLPQIVHVPFLSIWSLLTLVPNDTVRGVTTLISSYHITTLHLGWTGFWPLGDKVLHTSYLNMLQVYACKSSFECSLWNEKFMHQKQRIYGVHPLSDCHCGTSSNKKG